MSVSAGSGAGVGVVAGTAWAGPADDGQEWWQRLGEAWRRWSQRHETAVRRLRLARSVWLWFSLAWLLVLVVARPELRESVRVFVQLYWLLIVWFLLTRTRTVPWRLVAGLFSVGVVWSIASGVVLHELAQRVGAVHFGSLTVPGQVRGLGPMVALAGVGEESLKLVPLAVLALAAPGRVRRFAVVDWLLLGFASGLAFQAFEELARRTAANVLRPGLFDVINGVGNRDPGTGYPQYGWGPAAGWSQWEPGTEFPGHHATTALVAVTFGLAVAAWRHAGRRGGPVGAGWRAAAVVAPVAMWWVVVSVHAGGNATVSVGDRWLTAENPSVPWLIRAGWQVGNHGIGLRWLLLALLLVALLVDARHLHAGDRARADGGMLSLPFHPAARAEAWAHRIAGSAAAAPWRASVAAACALAAYAARDVAVLLTAHARQPGEPRLRALVRGRLATGMLRVTRAETLAQAVGPGTPARRRRGRLLGLAATVVLVTAGLWLGSAWAERIGTSPELQSWLAGLLDSLVDWWDGQSTGSKIAIGVGIAALVALSGGSLGLAFGVSGVATYLLSHGRGAADLVRDPVAATRSYLATATPMGVLADGAEAVLTFAPGNFAGAAAGRGVRLAAEDYARDPQAWLAARRALVRDDTGAIDLGAFYRGDPIRLADGSTAAALDPAGAAAFRQWYDGLPRSPLRAGGPEGEYQLYVYGDRERVVWQQRPRAVADGATDRYAAIGDAKYRAAGQSWYDPESMPEEMRDFVIKDMDTRLLKYQQAVAASDNPSRLVEVVTNDAKVADFVESRMRALGVDGYVRIEPWSPG